MTCADKRRSKQAIVNEVKSLFDYTTDSIDFDRFGYPTENDEVWTEEREPSELVTARGIACIEWLATRPEREIALVTHSSFLKHLFRAFGEQVAVKDVKKLHRLAGNAEIRSVCLAMHRGFYPPGTWRDDDHFVPHDHSFRRGRWAPTNKQIANMHGVVGTKSHLDTQESMPHLEK
jgi:hypothetical protein